MSSDDAFDAIDADLALLDQLPPADQVPVFERLNSTLASVLDETRESNSAPAGGGN